MEVKVTYGKNYDDMETLELEVNGKHELSVRPLNECPEDAYLERDLGFAYDIPDLMKRAYEAGKAGEDFTIIEVDESEAD
ncbi:hypothetical protein [Heyndrickxia coagulans]|uniref:hypothetical protein n=1 Tax=Heyndrickxia coagulans TaxID=1398 RepID=UPI000779D9F7|nr:hypothetical protein [Heyndrickxia coagulans]KYC67210.1 hypothetical protein B4100_3846 [Heyndrickxia coagulans]